MELNKLYITRFYILWDSIYYIYENALNWAGCTNKEGV